MDYSTTWHELDADVAAGTSRAGADGMVRRLVGQTSLTEAHLGVLVKSGLRCLLVRIPGDHQGGIPTLPSWSGLRSGVVQGEEKPVARRFLLLQQEAASPTDIFESVVADVASSVLVESNTHPLLVVRERLERWKAFFSEVGVQGLGKDAQQGLFGELWILRDHVLPGLGPVDAVNSWVGPTHANHDFQHRSRGLEVKTSTAKQHHRVHIANERQLDEHGLESLNLVASSFTSLEDGGLTLPQLVEDVRHRLSSDGGALRLFNDRLMLAGYLDAQSVLYRTGYVLREIRTYRVAEGFPRLVERDLSEGVGDLSYSVVLSACEAFRMEPNVVWESFKGKPQGGDSS